MKKILFPLLIAAVMAVACTGGNSRKNEVTDDSVYQWESIRQYIMQEPERAFAMVDTAQMRGVADVNYANWMRAQILLMQGSKDDIARAREYCMTILENKEPEADSLQRVKTYHLLVSIGQSDPATYQDAISYAIEGVRISHENGWNGEEALFYFDAGETMEKVQKGSGSEYLDRSLQLLRGSSKVSVLPMLSSYLGTAARLAINNGDYARGEQLTRERLPVVERIEREYTTAPAGFADQQRAYIYSILAYCQYQLGDKEAARRSADAFEKTRASQVPEHQGDILQYYALAGNVARVQQIYSVLEPYYREHDDTVSVAYAGLLNTYAYALQQAGQSHEAYNQLSRYVELTDSLNQRQHQQETLMYAQQMKTQEKEMALREKEQQARLHLIIIVALAAFLAVSTVFLWRITLAHRRLQEKNRQLFETIQQGLQEADKRQEALSRQPEEALSPSQQLYNRICSLMRQQQPYTESELNRESLAQMLGTNYNAVASAIRECAGGLTIGDFLDDWRIRHAAQLLADSDEPVGLVAEMSGFTSRSHFNTLFREKFKMTPSEYRKAAKEK